MQTLRDYSDNLTPCYTSGDIVTTNLCSLVVQSLVKDSNYIYSPNVRISGSSLSIIRLIKLTSSVNNQIIFSQKESGKGISIETNASGYLVVNVNGSTLFGNLQLTLNTVYAIGLSYNSSKIKLFVNNSDYEATFTSSIIESITDMIVNLTGQSGVLFYTNQVYSDLQKLVKKILYLATSYRISKNDGTLLEPVKGITLGNGYSSLGLIPNDTADFIYDAIPISSINDFTDAVLINSEIHSLSDKYRKQNLSSLIIVDELSTDKTKLFVMDKEVIMFDVVSVFAITFVEPDSGRVIGYTREKVNDTTFKHNYYKDNQKIGDEIQNSNSFHTISDLDLGFTVDGSKITLSPSNYVIDDLIIDRKIYVKNQVRSYYLADELEDTLNTKIFVAPVRNFSNEIIYTADSTNAPAELQPILDANKEVKTITKYEDEA